MLPANLCLACGKQDDNVHPLSRRATKYTSKCFKDMLLELTQIQTDPLLEQLDDKLPQGICSDCLCKLDDSYKFVSRARQVYDELLTKLRNGLQKDCLDETLIDMEIHHIKRETDVNPSHACGENATHINDSNGEAIAAYKWHAEIDMESTYEDVNREDFDGNPANEKQSLRKQLKENEKTAGNVTRQGRQRSKQQTKMEFGTLEGRHACEVCGKTFSWLRGMQRHARIHLEAPSHVCDTCGKSFLRKDMYTLHLRSHTDSRCQAPDLGNEWLFAQRLYSSTPLTCIKCKLCGLKCDRIKQLRVHLAEHISPETLCNLRLDSDLVKEQFGLQHTQVNMTDIKRQVCSDIAKGDQLDRYCEVVNAHGYEISLSDSDEEVEDLTAPYQCLSCNTFYTRKFMIIRHTLEQHPESCQRCDICQIGFVCDKLLDQHRRTQCHSPLKRYNCRDCPGKFIWKQNCDRHACIQNKLQSDTVDVKPRHTRLGRKRSPTSSKLQCPECDKVFIWPKDLTRHKRMHQPQTCAQYECTHCERKFYRKDGLKSHLRVHGEHLDTALVLSTSTSEQQTATPIMLQQLSQANGCKLIQCMICFSRHARISDLRHHLSIHQSGVKFENIENIADISRALYPEISVPFEKYQLIQRIQSDVTNGVELDRFISITNEIGIELSLESSETDSDLESEVAAVIKDRIYSCDLCQFKVGRKHQLYAHQLKQHEWSHAPRKCVLCQARFVNNQLLQHHYRSFCRNAQKPFFCHKCPLRFRWRDNLKLHIALTHQEVADSGEQSQDKLPMSATVDSYECVECKRTFKIQKDLTRHMLIHAHESSKYRCRWCARRFYHKLNLLQHLKRHGINAAQLPYAEALLNATCQPHGRKCIECKVCEQSFGSIAALRQHLLTSAPGTHHAIDSMLNYSITNQLGYELQLEDSETDDETNSLGTLRQYTCSICHLRCSRKYELHQHQQAMHRLERISDGCNLCIYKSVSLELIKYHQRLLCENLEKQFKCLKCEYKFMWESNLLRHLQLQHPSTDDNSKDAPAKSTQNESKAECQIFQCGQCTRKYNRKDRLAAHVKKCHAPGALFNSTKAAASSQNTKHQKSFLCAFCGKAVSSSSNLIIHIRRHTGEKPFKCDFCDMAFPRSSDLQVHRRTHTGERPHICTVCQKGFARSYKLQQHMRIHSGERPYKCTYCDKSFTQSNDLTLHIRRHTGERPYECDTCGDRFIQGTALKNHRMQHGHNQVDK
ncbi:zinc finger protein Xfin [Drosophila busckii]|uniref:zinc finger protein Xfin n=1 Tax=Drosophila busckii TaxID=30019 RepID=UPI00083EC75B|nr:zinc finger protein Xfin [Drosophila busckii]